VARTSDYAARVARAQAAGYASLSAQRTAQAHARGYSSRYQETIANKLPVVQATIQHYRDIGLNVKPGAENRLQKTLSRATYRKLAVLQKASLPDIIQMAQSGDSDAFYH